MRLVVDASVAAKWLLPEPDSDKAEAVLSAWNHGVVALLAPVLLHVEIANLLWKTAAQRIIGADDAKRLLVRFAALKLPLVPTSAPLLEEALSFSLSLKHPVYDCLYATLAMQERSELLTADEKLFRALRPSMAAVRLLTDWETGA